MAIVSLPNLGPDPFTVNASVLNGKVDPLATDYNGNIDDSNIAVGAAIANAKLNLASIAQAVTATGGLTISTTALTMSSMPINEAKGADIASAGTNTTNITTATGNTVHITGTTAITGFVTATAGIRRILIFDGILTFTHNSTSMILPTGANITTAAGDTCVVISEGSGNWRCISFQRKDGTPLASGFTPSVTNALSGSLIQKVSTETGASTTGSTAIPIDDTIPTITEGDEYMTRAITPNNTSNTLKITVVCQLANDGNSRGVAALYQDATSAALAVGFQDASSANNPATVTFVHHMAAGTTSSTTFRVRGGYASGTTTFNGFSGARKFGGALASSITIEEYKA